MTQVVYKFEDGTEYRLLRDWEAKTVALTTGQKREARAFRYGYFRDTKCCFSAMPIYPRLLHSGSVDLHHLVEIGKEGCNFLINLRLAYHGPNANSGKPSGIQTSEREKIPVSKFYDPTEKLHQLVDYQSGGPPMQANDIGIPKWLDFVCQEIQAQGFLARYAALNSGARVSGLTYQPILRAYNKIVLQQQKMLSFDDPGMPFEEQRSGDGTRYVKLREGWKIVRVGRLLRPVPLTEDTDSYGPVGSLKENQP